MYHIDTLIFWTAFAMVGVFFWLSGLLTFASSLRRYTRLKISDRQRLEDASSQRLKLIHELETDVKEKTKAIQDIVYTAHHHGPSPRISSARGLLNLIRLASPDRSVQDYCDMTDEQLIAARKEWIELFKELENLQ
jgi:hypothetical protein